MQLLRRRFVPLAGLLCVCALAGAAPASGSAAETAPVVAALAPVTRADRLILLDIANAGKRLVAVGERGVVFRSDDQGKTWQGTRTEVTRTLTAVAFADDKVGVAVGHGGSLLRSQDGGVTWATITVAEAGKDALLGVTSLGGQRFVAYGAFGLFIESTDGGITWVRHQIISSEFDRHISKVIQLKDSLLLVGESGTMATSPDGLAWQAITSPYVGSWFGALVTRGGAALVFGMRGNAYRSEDGGATWIKSELGVERSVMNGAVLADGGIVLVGNAGLLMISHDDGKTFQKVASGTGASLAQVVSVGGELVAVGDAGVMHLKAIK